MYNYYVGAANVSACSESPSAWPTGSNDNGNVAGYYYNDSVNSGLSHKASYGYDGVNRLTSAAATGNSTYSQTYSYTADGSAGLYGNLSCAPSGPGCVALTYNSSNRITTSGYTYDAAGNLTGDGTHTYQWDAEARLTVAYLSGTAVQTNTYNSLGQRVRDVTQTNTTDEAYGAGGELLWRFTGNSSDPNQRAFVSFSGGILAEYYSGGTIFDHPDQIGSMSTSSDYTGNTLNEKLFYPFGELWTGAAIPNFNTHQTFAHLPDYDPETDQYNTLNRHYSPSGRWLSPDPGGVKIVKLDDPQTWNMYAYVRNNPTTLTDPTGLEEGDCNGDQGCQTQVTEHRHAEEEVKGENTAALQEKPIKLDKDKVADAIDKSAKGTNQYGGHCARACHDALEAGGLTDKKDRPSPANDNGPFLVRHGAVVVAHGDTVKLPEGYKPQKGDVAVFEGDRKQTHYQSGHMEIYDGKQWVSDTYQSEFTPNRQDWPRGYSVYRFPD